MTEFERSRYEQLRDLFVAPQGGEREPNLDRTPQPSKLRVETLLENSKGNYIFDIKKDAKGPAEQTLSRNDVFVPTKLGLFIAFRSKEKPSTEVLVSYPQIKGAEPSIHAVGFTKADAEAIYNGHLSWLVGSTQLLDSFPTEKFRKVPRTQGMALMKNDNTIQLVGAQSQWDINEACETLIPRIFIAGTRDHKLEVAFDGAGLDFSCTEGYDPYLVLYMDGYLVKSGAEFINGKNPIAAVVGNF